MIATLIVLAAAAASWFFGAFWYTTLSKPWMQASGVTLDGTGKPAGGSIVPMILSAICMILVAAMMRQIFLAAGITTLGAGLLYGLGIGAFFITPWIMINNAYGKRPTLLTLIDGGYAILGCTIIGLVLTLFM